MIKLLLLLIYVFTRIGLFGFGGGYAMISMIQADLVSRYQWLTNSQFTDIVAISQMTPGPIGINAATYVGFLSLSNAGYGVGWALFGALLATFSIVLPSFVLMILISKFFMKYKHHPYVEYVFSGLRPALVGLIAAAALLLLTPDNFGTPEHGWHFYISVFIFLMAFLAAYVYRISPILIIIFCGVSGYFLF